MSELFGLDIAKLVADGIAAAGNLQSGALTKLDGGGTHSFQGFLEMREVRLGDTFVAESIAVMSILGASVDNDQVPEVNDTVSLGGFNGELARLIRRDPASAVYEFEVR